MANLAEEIARKHRLIKKGYIKVPNPDAIAALNDMLEHCIKECRAEAREIAESSSLTSAINAIHNVAKRLEALKG